MSIKIKTNNIKRRKNPKCNNENDDIDDAKHKKQGIERGGEMDGWIDVRMSEYIGLGKDGWVDESMDKQFDERIKVNDGSQKQSRP